MLALLQFENPIPSFLASSAGMEYISIQEAKALQALKTPTKTTPPITEASVPVWGEIASQLNLNDHVDSPRVQKQLHELLTNKSELQKSLQNSAPYIYYIYSQLKARHLPAELALIPIIESNYNPYDHNSIGANGLWQLMPGTAKGLGVKIKQGYDGRRDLISSTNAALDYYTWLANKFKNNWYLAIAAYNCGDGAVSAAVKRAHSNDYFHLSLPLETKLYVPRLLAIAIILKNPQKYGIELPTVKDTAAFTTVEINHTTSLKNYALKNGIDLKSLQQFNPEYRDTNINVNISKTLLIPIQH